VQRTLCFHPDTGRVSSNPTHCSHSRFRSADTSHAGERSPKEAWTAYEFRFD